MAARRTVGLALLTARVAAQAADADRPLLYAEGRVELKATPDKVWDLVGDFTGIHGWHPA